MFSIKQNQVKEATVKKGAKQSSNNVTTMFLALFFACQVQVYKKFFLFLANPIDG